MKRRTAFPPCEFDAACRELIRCHPFLSESSGRRSEAHNAAVGGRSTSKHLIGMARDFVAPTRRGLEQASRTAVKLRLWWVIHGKGPKIHLHVQGGAKGPMPRWWRDRYWKG